MNLRDRKKRGVAGLGQSVTELALVLPIMLLLVFGVFELGRVIFIFSSLNNATREAARFGASTGRVGVEQAYLNCPAIRQTARNAAFLAGLEDGDIQIAYDTPDSGSGTMQVLGQCGDLDADEINRGDRIVITVNKNVEPILPILPSDGFTLSFATARTILKNIVIGPVECSDGEDNDGDGLIDHPDDPGCSATDDTTEANCYRLSVSTTEGGAVSTEPEPNCVNRYIERTPIRLTAFPDERYVLKRWSFDGGVFYIVNPLEFEITGDTNVEAQFRLRTSDLRVEKRAPAVVYAEKPFTYEIDVTNLYTETARDVVINDTLPAGLQLEGWSITAGDCPTATETQFICDVPELPWGDTVTLEIDVLAPVVNRSPQNITNTATASTGPLEDDPDPTNNSATATTEVRPRAELTAHSKVGPADPVYAVTFFDYTVTVGNSGPSVATDVTIVDELQGGLKFVSSTSGCEGSGSPPTTVTCEIGELGVGVETSVVFTVEAPRNGRTVPNEATVSGNEYEDNTADNTVGLETNTIVESRADLELNKSAPANAYRDVPFDYVLAVYNDGPSDAQDVRIVDTLPAGVRYEGYGGSDGVCSLSGSTVTCNLGNVNAGTTESVILTVTPTIDEGTLTNNATVESNTDDLVPDNDTASATTTVTTDVRLSMSKTDSADPVVEGDAFAYTIRVDNNGASNATGVEVVDTLPAGIDLTGVGEPDGWACSTADVTGTGETTVSCAPDNGVLVGGLGATITINVTAGEHGTFTNYARVTADEDETGAEEQTTVEPSLDLSLSLTAPASGELEVPFDYTINVANSGPSDATSVVVNSPLDSAVSYETVAITAAEDWACSYDQTNHRVVCTIPTMAAGAEATFTITVTPLLSVDAVTSEGVISAEESFYDDFPDNDADSAPTTLTGSTTTTSPEN